MKNSNYRKTLLALPFAILMMSACGGQQSAGEEDSNDYRDTVAHPSALDGNNMRNDQPTEELTIEDSVDADSAAVKK